MPYLTFAVVLLASPMPAFGDETDKPPAKSTSPLSDKAVSSLLENAARIRAAVEDGKLSEAQAIAKFRALLEQQATRNIGESMTDGELAELGKKLKAAVANGEMTEAEAIQEYQRAARQGNGAVGKMMMKPKGRNDSFYAIVIGRLKSKDFELGEFTMDVDHVTSIYGDRRLKDTIIGQTVTVVGISGPWLDKLLVMKRGETLKLRSGTLDGTTISLSPKATVLERAAPFDPETYPIPPESFRGFQGVVIGTIDSKSDQGYDLTLRVEKVVETSADNRAAVPESIEGRLMDMQGFYNGDFRAKFDGLRIGDRIRVGAAHRVPEIDSLEVVDVLEKVK